MTAARLTQLQAALSPTQALLLSTPTDIHYFTGYQVLVPEEREAFICVTTEQTFLIHANFSPTPSQPFFIPLEGCRPDQVLSHLQKICTDHSLTQLLFDPTSLFTEEYFALQKLAQERGLQLQQFARQQIWELRMTKDDDEIALITEASHIVYQAITQVLESLRVGITEQDVAARLEATMRELGATGPAFPTIVAFGTHAALPHYQPADTPLERNQAVLIDAGAMYHHYRSDMTRTTWFGPDPTPNFTAAAQLVESAYQAALQRLRQPQRPPLTARDLDQAARQLITTAGFSANFIHTTGHGVGLDIHEPPSLSWRNETPLEPGMVITIEPGVYFTDQFGYRYENTVLITDSDATELTAYADPHPSTHS